MCWWFVAKIYCLESMSSLWHWKFFELHDKIRKEGRKLQPLEHWLKKFHPVFKSSNLPTPNYDFDAFKRQFSVVSSKREKLKPGVWSSTHTDDPFLCIFESCPGYKDRPGGQFSPTPRRSLDVSLATGRLTYSPGLHLYTGPVHKVIWRLRKVNHFASKVP